MRIRLARPGDAPDIIAFNAAMALETEGKRLFPEVIGAGVRSLLRRPKAGFYLLAETRARIVGAGICVMAEAQAASLGVPSLSPMM